MQGNRFTHVQIVVAILLLCLRAGSGAVVPGHVEAWGRNLYGEAVPPSGLDGVIAVAAGNTHSLALRTNGTVVAWGSDNNGDSTVTVPAGLSNVVAIAAYTFSAAVKADGTVAIWGSNSPEITNVPPEAVGVTALVLFQSAVIALRSNGTVVAWGFTPETNVPPGLSNVIQISGMNGHALALTSSGTIVGWGGNFSGESTHPPGLTSVVKVGAGQGVSMALKADGTLFRWGDSFGLPGDPPGLPDVVDFDLGNQHALALRGDGTVFAWGENFAGQSSVPALLNSVTAISAGANHNLVVTARPLITSMTAPISTSLGANVTLEVTATGEGPFRYTWQHNGTNLPAGTNASLTVRAIQPPQAGTYAVYVVNQHGYNYASTSVSISPPKIMVQPESRTVYRGENATFSVTASGYPPFKYQWSRNGVPIPNETNATVVAPTLSREESGVYRVTVTDPVGGMTTSSDAVLTVLDPMTTSLTLRPVLDTSIFSSGINPMGTATILSGTRLNGVRDRGLLWFDFASLPTNAVVESASLRFRLIRAGRGGGPQSTFRLHRVLKPWGAEATWTNASSNLVWSAAGAQGNVDYSTNGIRATLTFPSSDLDFGTTNELFADISEWVQNPATNYGWFLINEAEETLGSARHFGSSESQNPPQLFLRYSTPAEAPTIRGITRESTNFVFAIDGVAGWIYNIQTREEVDRGLWAGFTNVPAGAGLTPIVITVPMTNSHQFFRAFRN